MFRVCLTIALVAAPTLAADKLPPELALVPPDAAAFVTVRMDRLTGKAADGPKSDLMSEFEARYIGFPVTEIERVTAVHPTVPFRTSGADSLPVFVVTRTRPIDRASLVRQLKARPALDRGDEARRNPGRPGQVFEIPDVGLLAFVGDRTVVLAGGRNALPVVGLWARSVDPSGDAPLGPALAAAAEADTVVAAGATGEAFRSLVGAWKERDREFLALGRASAITLVGTAGREPTLAVRAAFPDQASARNGQAALAAMTGWASDALKDLAAGSDKAQADLARVLLTAIRDAGDSVRDGTTVTVTARMKGDEFDRAMAAVGRTAAARVRTAADGIRTTNNLKLMGLAIHNYHDANGQFPFADRPPMTVHPGLSWRVAILPYIEQDHVYREFKLDEPWDSEHNKKVIEKMPKLFAPPPGVDVRPGHTFYRMFDGPGTMSRAKVFTDVTDGSSNTFLVVEAGEPVVWTKPEEIEYDPKKPMPKLGAHFADGFHALLADGSTRFVRKSVDEKVLRAAITANGGETATLDAK